MRDWGALERATLGNNLSLLQVLIAMQPIRECEEHAWVKDRTDPHAREPTVELARRTPPSGSTVTEAVASIGEVLDGIGDPCPESPTGLAQ